MNYDLIYFKHIYLCTSENNYTSRYTMLVKIKSSNLQRLLKTIHWTYCISEVNSRYPRVVVDLLRVSRYFWENSYSQNDPNVLKC